MSSAKKHPNRLPVRGILTRLDVPSDVDPKGSEGFRLLLTTRAAAEALPSLKDMALNFAEGWNVHNRRQKCGVITEAWIEDGAVWIAGHVYAHDFPEVLAELSKPDVELGLSYDLIDAEYIVEIPGVRTLTKVTFIGAAIVLRHKAAYKTTKLSLVEACGEEHDGKISMLGVGSTFTVLEPQRFGRMRRWLGRLRTSRADRF